MSSAIVEMTANPLYEGGPAQRGEKTGPSVKTGPSSAFGGDGASSQVGSDPPAMMDNAAYAPSPVLAPAGPVMVPNRLYESSGGFGFEENAMYASPVGDANA